MESNSLIKNYYKHPSFTKSIKTEESVARTHALNEYPIYITITEFQILVINPRRKAVASNLKRHKEFKMIYMIH